MRYQRVVASRREINFACQFFRISLFIIAVEQELADALAKCFRSKIAFDPAAMADGNPASLFRDNHRDRIRLFSNSQPGAVAETEAAIKRFALADWKNTGRRSDASVAHDHPAIV